MRSNPRPRAPKSNAVSIAPLTQGAWPLRKKGGHKCATGTTCGVVGRLVTTIASGAIYMSRSRESELRLDWYGLLSAFLFVKHFMHAILHVYRPIADLTASAYRICSILLVQSRHFRKMQTCCSRVLLLKSRGTGCMHREAAAVGKTTWKTTTWYEHQN